VSTFCVAEIAKVRASLFQISGVKKEPLVLPEPEGEVTTLMEKVYVPVKEHPDFNFVGRILGPRGMTAKQLEQETGCKIMVRGKGSMRDKKKEEQNRGKPNWEHLTDELHVLLTVEDTENRATLKLARAVEEVKKLLVPVQADGEDELKKRQLMELAIINGTYRDSNTKVAAAAACDEEWRRVAAAAAETQRLLPGLATPMRTPSAPLGAPLILSPRISVPTTAASLLNGSGPPGSLLSAGDPHGLIYTPYADYANYAALAASPLLTEYATADHSEKKFGRLLTFVCWAQVQQPLRSSVGTWVRFVSTLIKGLALSREFAESTESTVYAYARKDLLIRSKDFRDGNAVRCAKY
ncbi:protein held out wings-like isoform X4, partial [Vespula maculifrons]